MKLKLLGLVALIHFFALSATAQILDTDKTFDVAAGDYTGRIAHQETHTYQVNLNLGQALVTTIGVASEAKRVCYEDLDFAIINSFGTKVDSSSIYSQDELGTIQYIAMGYKSIGAGIHKIVIARQKDSDGCKDFSFPYTVNVEVLPGHSTPARRVQAVTGIYRDKLPFAEIHEYSFSLGKNQTFKALMNANSAKDFVCYNDIEMNLFNSQGVEVLSNAIYSVPEQTTVNSAELELKATSSDRYTLQVLREPDSDGDGCDQAKFNYELHVTLPPGQNVCPKRQVKAACNQSCAPKCSKKKNKKACKATCVNKCIAKGQC